MKPGWSSATAMLVALSVARRGGAHGLPVAAVQLAERALAIGAQRGSAFAMLGHYRAGRSMLAAIVQLVLPGLGAHHCARKAWFWGRVQHHALARQPLIWLGVGFDGLGRALLAQDCGTGVVETDHPDTLELRRSILRDGAAGMRAIELPDQLEHLLALCAEQPATIICEGVLMYLSPRTVIRTLRALAALPSPPRLIFSVLDTLRPGGRGFRRPRSVAYRWLERHAEPFRWRARPDRIRGCLAAAGYVVTARWNGSGFGEYAIEAEAVLTRRRSLP